MALKFSSYQFKQDPKVGYGRTYNSLKGWTITNLKILSRRKMTKWLFSSKENRAIKYLELVHIDMCGPINVQARVSYKYLITFMDDYFIYDYVYLMHRKSESLEIFSEFHARQLGKFWKHYDQIEMVNMIFQ